MKKSIHYLSIILLAAAVSGGTTWFMLRDDQTRQENPYIVTTAGTVVQPAAYNRFTTLPQATETDFTQAAELSVNAVVHVMTTYNSRSSAYGSDPLFEFFFGRPQSTRPAPAQQASGSGVIIAQDGYIVTNNHVIDKAQHIEVVLNDKRRYTAQLVGTDPATDIALLKIDADSLPVIRMGDSDALRVGEWVLAVGNPFNLTSTVTAGIVSAKARNINILNSDMKIESFIQTDAAVNPGNSGGALVNTHGELVGINTAIASQTGSYSGYSFAVPVRIVQKVVSDIRQYGHVQRALLGVQMAEITPDLQQQKGLATLQGVYVVQVMPSSAAEQGGIREGDIIVQVDDTPISTGTNLQEQIGLHHPGDTIRLTVLRGTRHLTLPITLSAYSPSTHTIPF